MSGNSTLRVRATILKGLIIETKRNKKREEKDRIFSVLKKTYKEIIKKRVKPIVIIVFKSISLSEPFNFYFMVIGHVTLTKQR